MPPKNIDFLNVKKIVMVFLYYSLTDRSDNYNVKRYYNMIRFSKFNIFWLEILHFVFFFHFKRLIGRGEDLYHIEQTVGLTNSAASLTAV